MISSDERRIAMELVVLFSWLSLLVVSGNRISEKMCNHYRNALPPISTQFSESDEDAGPKEYPFMATVENDTHFQQGILISENFVLSLASGVDLSFGRMYVVLGDLELNTNIDDARPRTYDVIEEIAHPDFKYHSFSIKLYKLNETIRFDAYVRPACLAASTASISEQLIQIGWSTTNFDDNDRLHKVKLHYVPDISCKRIYREARATKFIRGIDNGSVFCAGSRKDYRHLCEGSTGSAVINGNPKASDEVVGFAYRYIFPSSCEGCNCNESLTYAIVRTSAIIDWIEGVVWPGTETVSQNDEITATTIVSPATETTRVTTELTPIPKQNEEKTTATSSTTALVTTTTATPLVTTSTATPLVTTSTATPLVTTTTATPLVTTSTATPLVTTTTTTSDDDTGTVAFKQANIIFIIATATNATSINLRFGSGSVAMN